MRMKYYSSSFLYLSCLLMVAIIGQCRSESFFGKLVRFATGGEASDNSNNNNNNNINNNVNNINGSNSRKNKNKNKNIKDEIDFPTTQLSNGVQFPLVGVGVGNMQPEVVPAIISHGLKADKNIRLIDTSNVSGNEFLVAKGIVEGVENRLQLLVQQRSKSKSKQQGQQGTVDDDEDDEDDSETEVGGGVGVGTAQNSKEVIEVHVISKIWYTHLGYNRTLLSAKSSLESLKEALDHPNINLKVHLMLHWPRCYDEIPWMDCEGEEENLPEEMKSAGPPPHLDKENAWKGSWRALEELLLPLPVADADDDENKNKNPIASIGVSNFHRKELEELSSSDFATVDPHIVETDTWSLLYDPLLIEFCHKRGIHLVAHHLMEGVIFKAESAPFASHHLLSVANDMTKAMASSNSDDVDVDVDNDDDDKEIITAAQIVLAWLVQHSISVIPRTTDLYHLQENSASSLSKIPAMDDRQVQIVAQSVEALISGEDLTEDAFVTLTFHAKSAPVFLYWHDPEFGGEIEVARIEKGTSFQESSHPGHKFRIYYDYDAPADSEDKGGSNSNSKMELFTVSGNYGEHRHIEL